MFPLLSDLAFENPEVFNWLGTRVHKAIAPIQSEPAIGVDPGRNFGVTAFIQDKVCVYWGTFPQQEKNERWRYGASAIAFVRDVVGEGSIKGWPAIVEGASYNDKFGQVGLAEVRFGFAYGLEVCGAEAKIVPPATIRKAVLGNGRGPVPYESWPNLNTNATDSLITACYAFTHSSA